MITENGVRPGEDGPTCSMVWMINLELEQLTPCLGHSNFVTYCRYCLESAHGHVEVAGSAMA